jgi:hypothetical protein
MCPTRLVSATALLSILLAAAPKAQLAWTAQDTLGDLVFPALVWDQVRGRAIAFGGIDTGVHRSATLAWDGTRWQRLAPATVPPARGAHAMAYDSARGRVVMFGGITTLNAQLSDTWEWDGSDWRSVPTTGAPSARSQHAMCFDAQRGRVVLFGGNSAGTYLADTWEWDGSTWTSRSTPAAMEARCSHALAWDSARKRAVLFAGTTRRIVGGFPRDVALDDTWEHDGTSWQRATSALIPTPRAGHALAFDSARNRTVLFGSSADTWEWDGSAWAQRTTAVAPEPRSGHAMAFDAARARVVLFAGRGSLATLSDTWEWDGTAWTKRDEALGPPAAGAAIAHDTTRDRLVLLAGSRLPAGKATTWEYVDGTWLAVAAAGSPSNRTAHAMAYDPSRRKLVLFGGASVSSGALADTWEFDGAQWLQRHPANSPSPRYAHAMFYDPARARVVLFGGSWVGETWEWDGNDWRRLAPGVEPPPSVWCGAVYDTARGNGVLLRGNDPQSVWLWASGAWVPLPRVVPARSGVALAWDAGRARVVAFGGADASSKQTAAIDEWDGSAWQQRPWAGPGPSIRTFAALGWQRGSGRMVLFGGESVYGGARSDTWELAPVHPAAATPLGAGCAGASGTPELAVAPSGLPWLGSKLALELASLPPAQPATLCAGASATSWSGLALPLDLAFFGMPGCAVRASLDLAFPLAPVQGAARWELPVPGDPGLLGAVLYVQGIAADPTANARGLILSSALSLRVGSK